MPTEVEVAAQLPGGDAALAKSTLFIRSLPADVEDEISARARGV